MWKGTASSEKATALNPTDAFSHQPQNHPARALVDTCPAEQMGSTTPSTHTHPRETFSFLKAFSQPGTSLPRAALNHSNLRAQLKFFKNPLPSLSGPALASHLNIMVPCLSHKDSQAREGPGPLFSPSKHYLSGSPFQSPIQHQLRNTVTCRYR